MIRYQKGKTDLDFTEARDSEWQWNQLDNMQVCTSLQTDNHASTPPLCFLQARCPSCRPTNSVKALKATLHNYTSPEMHFSFYSLPSNDRQLSWACASHQLNPALLATMHTSHPELHCCQSTSAAAVWLLRHRRRFPSLLQCLQQHNNITCQCQC